MRIRHSLLALCAVSLSCMLPATAQQTCSNKQTPQEIDARIDSLISKMTIAERIAQLEDRAPAIPRIGLPGYNWWNEGLHGAARDGYATVFPQAIGMAATWDAELIHHEGETVSTEARAKFNGHGRVDTPRYGGLTIWSPNINIFRDPRWGRGQETYGEDPFLTGTLGTQFVKGVQGDDAFYLRADATPKHFAAHSGPERGRDEFNSVVSAHDLNDTYFHAFHAVIRDAHAAAMMCSYNSINGVPSCAKSDTLQDMVRGQWNFSGYVVSDCDAVGDITDYHHYTKTGAEGAADALNAGVDLDCGNTYDSLNESYAHKLVSEETINRALHRLVMARIHLGALDPKGCTPYDGIDNAVLDSPEHKGYALKAAEESMVLLQNDGVLPLKPAQSIAVIGASADMIKILEANYHGTAVHPITPLEGLRAEFPKLNYAQGSLMADGVSALVPRNALRTGISTQAEAGLTAEYFNAASLDGAPAVSTRVEKVDLDLDRVGPDQRITSKQFAARWSGYIVPPAAGDYLLRVNVERCWDCKTHDHYKLIVDGKPVVVNEGGKNDPDRATLHFTDAAAHAIQLELIHSGEDEGIALEWEPPAAALLEQAVKAAQKSDVIVAFVGLSPDLEGEALQLKLDGFDGGDRTSLDLPVMQRNLIARLQQLHKPLVLVLASGSAVALNADEQKAAAVLEAWYPGEEGGRALANLLAGKANPSGRLPVTFYRSAADLPAFSDYSMAHRTYRYFDGPVLYPFGYGLSYSKFVYGPVTLSQASVAAGQALTATVRVQNDGHMAGDDVAELYIQPQHVAGAPNIALRGFQRVALKSGESRELTFALTPEQMSFTDDSGAEGMRAGEYRLFVGSTQPVKDAQGTQFRIVQ